MKIKSVATAFVLLFVLMISFSLGNVFAAPEVIDFELEIELKDQTKYDIEYEVNGTVVEAEYQVPGSPTLYGEEAQAMIEPLLQRLELVPDMDKKELKEKILSIFTIDKRNLDDFELEVIFNEGQKLKIDK